MRLLPPLSTAMKFITPAQYSKSNQVQYKVVSEPKTSTSHCYRVSPIMLSGKHFLFYLKLKPWWLRSTASNIQSPNHSYMTRTYFNCLVAHLLSPRTGPLCNQHHGCQWLCWETSGWLLFLFVTVIEIKNPQIKQSINAIFQGLDQQTAFWTLAVVRGRLQLRWHRLDIFSMD